MNTAKKLVVVSIALALGMSSAANAATQKEDDSAYQWGRWAVLSPAAGGSEPYAAGTSPVGQNSPRPETAPEFEPEILVNDEPPVEVESFCTASANCGYATYYKGFDEEYMEDSRFEPADVVDDYEESDNTPGSGPVLARFNLETFPIDDGEGRYEIEGVADYDEEDEELRGARFEVTDTGDENFPDIESVDMEGDGYFSAEELSRTSVKKEDGSQTVVTFTSQVSTLEETFDSEEVDTGIWSDETATRTEVNSREGLTVQFDFSSPGGFFVFGKTATIDQMEAFSAGNVTAVYQGSVIDYESAVTMEFDFGGNVVHGVFASENGFNGFHGHGQIDGINFSGSEGENKFLGSFFSGAENVSGAVTNGSQLGVYSADHVHPHLR